MSLRKVFEFCQQRKAKGFQFICDTVIAALEKGDDPQGICLDFVSYTQAMDDATKSYFSSNKLVPVSNGK